MTLLNYDILAVMVYERIGLLICIRIVICHLDLVVAESEVLYAEEIEDTWVEYAECVVLDEETSVVSTLCIIKLRNTGSYCDTSRTPCCIAIVTVLEDIVADDNIAYTGLLEPEVTVTLKKDGCTRDVEVVVLDDDLAT